MVPACVSRITSFTALLLRRVSVKTFEIKEKFFIFAPCLTGIPSPAIKPDDAKFNQLIEKVC